MECGKVSSPPPRMTAPDVPADRRPPRQGVEEALCSLDAGLGALFARSGLPKVPAERAHPLCECALLLPPPRAFRWLRRLPVLKRRALAAWKRQVDQPDVSLSRAVAATAAFCAVLAQCGLLHPKETEVLLLLVESSSPTLLKDVLTDDSVHSRTPKTILPLRSRLLLASAAFATQTGGQPEWTAEVAAKLAEELLQAAVMTAPSAKQTKAALCEFCSSARGQGGAAAREDGDQWGFVSSTIRQRIADLQGSKDRARNKAALEGLVALRNAIVTSGVETRDAPTSIRALSASSNSSLQGSAPSPSRSRLFLSSLVEDRRSAVALSMQHYQTICGDAVQAAGARVPVESSSDACFDPSRLASMWALAWQKEFERRRKFSVVHLSEIVMDCARADTFALAAAGQSPQRAAVSLATRLPGCEVVMRVIAAMESTAAVSIISALAEVWAQCDSLMTSDRRSPSASGSSVAISTAVKALCIVYLERALSKAGCFGSPTEASGRSASSPASQGRKLLESLRCISLMASDCRETSHWTDLWDMALLFHDQSWSSGARIHECDGLRWCAAIKACVMAASEVDESSTSSTVHRDLRTYCLGIMHGVLTTGGAYISSGERFQRALIQGVTDREPVQQLLLTMLEQFGQEWMDKLLLSVLQSLARATSRAADPELWIGVRTLLFPAMSAHLRAVSHSSSGRHHQVNHGPFVETLRSVAEQLHREEVGDEYVSALLSFCCAWDEFIWSQEETRRSSEVAKAGVQAVVEMGIYAQLIERYSDANGAISREKTSVLVFLSEVLQRASDYPRSLEAKLFDLVTRITEVVGANEASCVGFLPEKQDAQNHMPRISHSTEILQVVFHAASVADVTMMREAVRRLEDSDQLDQLVQQLKRWVVLMEAEQDSIAREARLEFAVLCNRLVHWAPHRCRDLQLLATPLGGRTVGAVKAVMKLARKTRTPGNASSALEIGSALMPTLVHMEMAVRAYLQAAALPDLCGLTMLLVDTFLRCEKKSVREKFATVVQRTSGVLILECVLTALSSALKSIHAFNALQSGVLRTVTEDSRHAIASSRRAVSALELLSSEKPAFGLSALSWSSKLFDGELSTLWLPYFFDFVLGTGLHPASDTLVKSFINSIIVSLNRDDEDDRVNLFQSSYCLAAMLSAVQFANRLQLVAVSGADQEQYGTLQSVLAAVIAKLVVVSIQSISDEVKAGTKDSSDVLVVWQRPMRVGQASINEDKLQFSDGIQILSDDIDEAVGDIFFDYAADETTEAPAIPSVGVMLSFSQWLVAATAFSQAFTGSSDPSLPLAMQSWERTFLYCANDLYLPLEFDNCAFAMASAWMTAWLSTNLALGESGKFLNALPFQVAWFQRMIRLSTGVGPSKSTAKSTNKIFDLLFQSLALVISAVDEANGSVHVVSAGLRCVQAVELVELSVSVDFNAADSNATGVKLIQAIEELIAAARPLPLESGYRIIHCILELEVFLYVLKLGGSDDRESSLQFLDRLCAVIRQIGAEDAAIPIVVDLWQQWACRMQAKYSCLDRTRCQDVLHAIIEVTTPSDGSEDPESD